MSMQGMNISSHTPEKLPFETQLNEHFWTLSPEQANIKYLWNLASPTINHHNIWNPLVEHKWKTILETASLQLTVILISHYETVIAESCKQIHTLEEETDTIIEEKVKTETNWYDEVEISQQLNQEWEEQCKQAIQLAKVLKQELHARKQHWSLSNWNETYLIQLLCINATINIQKCHIKSYNLFIYISSNQTHHPWTLRTKPRTHHHKPNLPNPFSLSPRNTSQSPTTTHNLTYYKPLYIHNY